jgi:hypothetical protein
MKLNQQVDTSETEHSNILRVIVNAAGEAITNRLIATGRRRYYLTLFWELYGRETKS